MASSSSPRVGVVTVTYNSANVLSDFLDSIAGQLGVDVRLYAVDNASSDDSVAQLRAEQRIPGLQVIANSENLGVAVGNNQGIELALADQCDWVLLLNNDTYFDAGMIAALVAEAESAALDIVSPVIEATEPPATIWYGGGRFIPWQGYKTTHDSSGHSVDEFPSSLTRTGYASTCCLLVRPSVFQSVGLMDPIYFVYFDDVDFAVRCTKAGYEYWVTPTARIVHKASSLTGGKSSPFTIKWVSRNWPLIARRHLQPAQGLLALAYIRTWMLARLLTKRDSPAVYKVRAQGFWEGVRAARAPRPGMLILDTGERQDLREAN